MSWKLIDKDEEAKREEKKQERKAYENLFYFLNEMNLKK